MLALQEWVLFWGHVLVVVFNTCGWIWRRTRVLHLVTIGLTAFSWFALGAIYGWGYCFCTDYHADVLRRLGNPDANLTFIQLMFKRILGMTVSQPLADTLAVVVFVLILIATAAVWAADLRRRTRPE
jgi:hypothetical protein